MGLYESETRSSLYGDEPGAGKSTGSVSCHDTICHTKQKQVQRAVTQPQSPCSAPHTLHQLRLETDRTWGVSQAKQWTPKTAGLLACSILGGASLGIWLSVGTTFSPWKRAHPYWPALVHTGHSHSGPGWVGSRGLWAWQMVWDGGWERRACQEGGEPAAGSLPLPRPRLGTDPILLEAGAPEAPPSRSGRLASLTGLADLKAVLDARRLIYNEPRLCLAENRHTQGYSFGTESNSG